MSGRASESGSRKRSPADKTMEGLIKALDAEADPRAFYIIKAQIVAENATDDLICQINRIRPVSPTISVLQQLRPELRAILTERRPSALIQKQSFIGQIRSLVGLGIIPRWAGECLDRLQRLRNLCAHNLWQVADSDVEFLLQPLLDSDDFGEMWKKYSLDKDTDGRRVLRNYLIGLLMLLAGMQVSVDFICGYVKYVEGVEGQGNGGAEGPGRRRR